MIKALKHVCLTIITASLFACAATPDSVSTAAPVSSTNNPVPLKTVAFSTASVPAGLTLEKIMSDPDWIGRSPQNAFYSSDGQTIYFQQKREGSQVRDQFKIDVNTGAITVVDLEQLHSVGSAGRIQDPAGNVEAWRFEGNIFVRDRRDNTFRQLTRSKTSSYNLRFLSDGRLTYQQGNVIYVMDIQSGLTQELVSWTFSDAPKANQEPADYIAEQQLELIDFVNVKRKNRQDQFNQKARIKKANPSIVSDTFYLPKDHRGVEVSVSPNGRYALVVSQKDKASRSDSDVMPNYIGEDGRIKTETVRQRVADAKPVNHQLWLFDLVNHTKHKLSYQSLPGFNEDVLAAVKTENAQANGDEYEINRLPRDIGLMLDWGWSQSAIQWHKDGSEVAIMLEAWDNKDRWIATVDFDKVELVSQHRLHDDAWVNYNFNSFGWLNRGKTLYYLSEESGYSHLYVKALGASSRQLTSGQYEVDNLTVSDMDEYIYFTANRSHPGIYEVFRVEIETGAIEQLTELNGMTEYVLNDQEDQLLLTHSKLTQPPELFIAAIGSGQTPAQLTDTLTDAFKTIQWQAPQIIPVPSTHADKPVYARVYLPENYQQGEARRAVIFNHGAGYLQNSHLGWSGYFREFMFHNLLVEQGYVVMDMDYRASKGYGRDWRTAIYRHMGKPETEDLRDGVDWLVKHANVDRNRIGTYGGSYGGFMTFMALFTAPDLFQAGAALRPVTDWAHYNHPYTSNILNMPDVDPIAYERSSPIYFAEGLAKPLLINAPMVDSNVFFVDVVRLVQRLIELEKQNFETAIYPVESHGFVQPSSWLDEYRRIYKLFEENL